MAVLISIPCGRYAVLFIFNIIDQSTTIVEPCSLGYSSYPAFSTADHFVFGPSLFCHCDGRRQIDYDLTPSIDETKL